MFLNVTPAAKQRMDNKGEKHKEVGGWYLSLDGGH